MKTHCIKCGTAHDQDLYPKVCDNCGTEAYSNPIPVAVVVIPVISGGIIVARRNINPKKGELALPGGFMETGETIEEAGCREVFEELEIKVKIKKVLGVESNSVKTNVLIFLEAEPVDESIIKDFTPNQESQEVKIIKESTPLAFPAHQKYADLALKKS